MPEPIENFHSDPLLNDLFARLNIVVLKQAENDSFTLIGQVPGWFHLFCKGARTSPEGLAPQHRMPFLENFLIDAEEFWARPHGGRLTSGPWIETDDEGNEYALEASAVNLGEDRIVVIELLGTAYQNAQSLLQKARENLLLQEYLESEINLRTMQIRQREEEISLRLVAAMESRDGETGPHIRRLGLYCAALAEALGWRADAVERIRLAAPMHDIGKIGIPDRFLLKPGKLTLKEFAVVKCHSEIGASILDGSEIPAIRNAQEIALCHHERWDGAGYPKGLAGVDIPESARIVSVADAYDALRQKRIYKPALDEDQALQAMHRDRGTHFDPRIYDCFISILPKIRQIFANNPG